MLFVKKVWSHLNYYNITHNIPDLAFESVNHFNVNPANLFLFKFNI